MREVKNARCEDSAVAVNIAVNRFNVALRKR